MKKTPLLERLRRLGIFLHLLVRGVKRNNWPAKAENVPFSEIPCGETFWWKDEVYVKETEELIFLEEPFRRPFAWREIVQVYPPNEEVAS